MTFFQCANSQVNKNLLGCWKGMRGNIKYEIFITKDSISIKSDTNLPSHYLLACKDDKLVFTYDKHSELYLNFEDSYLSIKFRSVRKRLAVPVFTMIKFNRCELDGYPKESPKPFFGNT